MVAFRRASWNFALDRAVEWARDMKKPLVILEALRCGYPWASDRLHRFILDGMAEKARRFSNGSPLYFPYVEPRPGAGKGLLNALANKAAVVITDDFPAFFLPKMVSSAADRLRIRMEQVDSNGILPMRAADRVYTSAYAFRRFLQKTLPSHLHDLPRAAPFKGVRLANMSPLPKRIHERWPLADPSVLEAREGALRSIPIDHRVSSVKERGGTGKGQRLLKAFVESGLDRYEESHNHPDDNATSRLSPYLHFGYLSAHQILRSVMESENWFFDRLSPRAAGHRKGWWGMGNSAEAFLDQLITWRELGFNMCWQHKDYDRFRSLPGWCVETLSRHAHDERTFRYTLDDFQNARTHDPLWNAAQRELTTDGRLHNYLRMLWGKKILEWSETPQRALKIMVELNNRYALDGRDPNSYSGIFWVLGRYDRAWGPERPIFGKIRYMSSKNTARKVRLREYLKKYGP
jgi:deoxyribodipyrimidine photo-lyase